jgi:general secretion pathway protein D
VNAVLVFAPDQEVLAHCRQWAASLDQAPTDEPSEESVHFYQVRNTRAADLHGVLSQMLGGLTASAESPLPEGESKKAASAGAPRLVVDEHQNALIFQGDNASWRKIMSVVQKMDRPTRMVLIEVTVAEITLDRQQELGIEWLLTDMGFAGLTGTLGTLGGLGIGSGGVSYVLNNAGQTRAILNAMAQESRVTILSTPRLMVKSGGTASIDVGTEVPTVTRQSTSPDIQEDGNTGLVQEIQYRKTGVLLNVKPIVHSGNRVDLEISQEVSESQAPTPGGVNSPSIFTRKIETSMGVEDGGSILLGGLISSTESDGYTGIPFLSKIPVLGRLFRVDKKQRSKTEMIMLIVPYVLNNHRDAEAVTNSFQELVIKGDMPKED